MIKSILDTDLYKFSTSFAYFQLYPESEGTFAFTDRAKEDWREHPEFLNEMRKAFKSLRLLHLTDTERDWCIEHIPYIPSTYWTWLQSFEFEPEKIKFSLDDNGVFECEVTDKMFKVTLYEIAVLATYAEVRNRVLGFSADMELVKTIIEDKVKFANENNIVFSEFGTRRRFSYDVQKQICATLKYYSKTCVGTSNVHFAQIFNMKPIGTFPHEWIMFHGAIFGYKRANYLGLEDWVRVYDGELGIALIDTYTTKSFLKTFTHKQACLFEGLRQDSGDEFVVGEMILEKWRDFRIDAKSKTIVFSNALDFQKAKRIKDYFEGECKCSFGIGTNLSCDPGITDYKPANIVMKLSKCRFTPKDYWEDCIKISDDIGKHMGNQKEVEIAKHELHLN